MSTALVALVLLPLALALVGGVFVLLVGPFLGPLRSTLERASVQRCRQRMTRADALLNRGDREGALRELEHAFWLGTVRGDGRLLDELGRLHAGVLSRLLAIANEPRMGRIRLLALAKVDRLLDHRMELQRARLQLRNRSVRDGRRIQLEQELRRNARAVRHAVREAIADVQVLAARRIAAGQ